MMNRLLLALPLVSLLLACTPEEENALIDSITDALSDVDFDVEVDADTEDILVTPSDVPADSGGDAADAVVPDAATDTPTDTPTDTASDAADTASVADVSDVSDTQDVADVAPDTDAADTAADADTADVADTSDASDASDVADTADISDASDVADTGGDADVPPPDRSCPDSEASLTFSVTVILFPGLPSGVLPNSCGSSATGSYVMSYTPFPAGSGISCNATVTSDADVPLSLSVRTQAAPLDVCSMDSATPETDCLAATSPSLLFETFTDTTHGLVVEGPAGAEVQINIACVI